MLWWIRPADPFRSRLWSLMSQIRLWRNSPSTNWTIHSPSRMTLCSAIAPRAVVNVATWLQ
jgi:hypothetical protein